MPSPLRRDQLAADPLAQAARWLDQARRAGVRLPEAMALATADARGVPGVRMVILKRLDDEGLAFTTDTRSRKAGELAANQQAAAVLHWSEVGRQIRAEGPVRPLRPDEARAFWDERPVDHRAASWASHQGAVAPDRAALDAAMGAAQRQPDVADMPPHWGGWVIRPDLVELWQAGPNRLHDRFAYRRAAGGWRLDRLWP